MSRQRCTQGLPVPERNTCPAAQEREQASSSSLPRDWHLNSSLTLFFKKGWSLWHQINNQSLKIYLLILTWSRHICPFSYSLGSVEKPVFFFICWRYINLFLKKRVFACLLILWAVLLGRWDLVSPTEDGTPAPCSGSGVLTPGPQGSPISDS